MSLTLTYVGIFIFNYIMYFIGAPFEITMLNLIGVGFVYSIHLLENSNRSKV